MIYIILLIAVTLPILTGYIIDTDIWWHMSCGREMLATGAVDVSHFYYTPVNTLIKDFQFTWLGDIILYLTHFVGGSVGLQILRVEFIAIALWCIWSISDKKLNLFKVFIFSIFTLGAYQWLLMRNSIFSLPFLAILWYLFLSDHKYKYWYSTALLIFWSQVHGSVILGVCMFGVLAVSTNKNITVRGIMGLLIAGVIVGLGLYLIPFNISGYFSLPDSFNLNGTLWNVSGMASKDFMSPFLLNRPYSAAMLVLSVLYLMLIRKIRLVYILPFLCTLIPALGYTRMVGYHVFTCAILLVYAEKNKDLYLDLKPIINFGMILITAFVIWNNYYRSIGVGESPNYKVLNGSTFHTHVFADASITGYLYFNHGIKGFWDTFHAPHPQIVRQKYREYMTKPDLIPSGINTCVIPKSNAPVFLKSKKWKQIFHRYNYFGFRRMAW